MSTGTGIEVIARLFWSGIAGLRISISPYRAGTELNLAGREDGDVGGLMTMVVRDRSEAKVRRSTVVESA